MSRPDIDDRVILDGRRQLAGTIVASFQDGETFAIAWDSNVPDGFRRNWGRSDLEPHPVEDGLWYAVPDQTLRLEDTRGLLRFIASAELDAHGSYFCFVDGVRTEVVR